MRSAFNGAFVEAPSLILGLRIGKCCRSVTHSELRGIVFLSKPERLLEKSGSARGVLHEFLDRYMETDFPYRNVLITGASSGLGAELARAFIARGCTVWGTSRDEARISVEGVIPVSVDLAHAEPIQSFVNEMQLELGEIDLLINNAGYGVFGNLEDMDFDDIHDQVELMLTAPALLAKAVLPGMKMRKKGCIVNVSSLAVCFPLPGMSLYNASKAGLSSFSHCLADETRQYGIRVIDFQPGDFRSGFLEATSNMGEGDKAWRAMERHMRNAPDAVKIARALVAAIENGREGSVVAGSFFQARLATFAHSVLPGFVMRYFQSLYMGKTGRRGLNLWM